jgi:hypothetical protein
MRARLTTWVVISMAAVLTTASLLFALVRR